MKEMHLTPDLWVVSAKAIFLPKLAAWKDELQFWKQEIIHLQRLILFGNTRIKPQEKETLATIAQQLTCFVQEQIPLLEQAIPPLERVLQGKALGCKFRKVEAHIEQLRKTYHDIKMQLLPFLAKFVTTSIW